MQLRKLGKIKAAQGLKGEVFILLFSKDYSILDQIKVFYIQNEHQESEYRALSVVSFHIHKDGARVLFEGVKSRNDSELLVGQELYVQTDVFQSTNGESLYLVEIENFKVIDEHMGDVGQIIGFSSNGIQDILLVQNKAQNQNFEIPFVDAYVKNINYKDKIINMSLPEGLLEINNSSDLND